MGWVKIFEGVVMGDEIKVERFEDEDSDGEFSIKVTAKDKNPSIATPPIIDQGSVIIPPPPNDPEKTYKFEYDSVDDMYENFAKDSGRPPEFIKSLEDAIKNY